MNLRKEAQGRTCQIRLPGCQHDYGVVLCHRRMAGDGIGRKPIDARGAWGCPHCHNVVDARSVPPDGYTWHEVIIAFDEGVFRTQDILFEEGKIRYE